MPFRGLHFAHVHFAIANLRFYSHPLIRMSEVFEITGGARVGWLNWTWPFAHLTAKSDQLSLNVGFGSHYTFTPDTIAAIKPYTMIPVLGWGVRIEHCVPEYPASMIFWTLGSPQKLVEAILTTGFQSRAPLSAVPQRYDLPVRWSAIILAIAVWNILFILGAAFPGPLTFVALGLLFATVLATRSLPAFQRLVLKPGRHVSEIRPALTFLMILSGLMFAMFALFFVLERTGVMQNQP